MAPKEFIAARQDKTNRNEDLSITVAGEPFYPNLVVDPKDEDSIRRAVAIRFSANGESNQPMARGIFIDPADIRDKIEYKVKADRKGLTLKVEYKQEFKEAVCEGSR